MSGAARNLELKVRVEPEYLTGLRARLIADGQAYQRLTQIDTYFPTPRGRLKIRQIIPDDQAAPFSSRAELIAYERPVDPGVRWSHYHRVSIPIAIVEVLRAALTTVLGSVLEVRKTRDVVICGHTRIHLDVVAELGCFVELETLANDRPETGVIAELREVARCLRIDTLSPIAGSYCDLLSAGGTG